MMSNSKQKRKVSFIFGLFILWFSGINAQQLVTSGYGLKCDRSNFILDCCFWGWGKEEVAKNTETPDFKINSFPNPFTEKTTVVIEINEKSRVFVEILNMQGRQLKILMDQDLIAGQYRLEWNGTRADQKKVSSGVYLCSVRVGNEKLARQLLLVKE